MTPLSWTRAAAVGNAPARPGTTPDGLVACACLLEPRPRARGRGGDAGGRGDRVRADAGDGGLRGSRAPGAPGASFVAGFDADGTTLFAFALDTDVSAIARTSQGAILIAGRTGGDYTGPDGEAYLYVATPAGVARTHRFTGPGNQYIQALAAAPDGLAWVEVDNGSDDDRPSAVMQIGSLTFSEPGTYLFKLVP